MGGAAHGRDSYGDPDYVSVYGLHPADWYAKGVGSSAGQ
jgi:hypothetical protein